MSLQLLNLRVAYSPEKEVIKGISTTFSAAHIHGIVGFNGAGKTSLLNTLAGIVPLSGGSILWDDRPLTRHDIAYLETTNFFYSYLSGRDYLRIFPNKSTAFDEEGWAALLELPLDELIENYSTGMKKKLALLGIIKLNRSLIILDEPFNGLDMQAVHLLKEVIARLRQQQKTVLVTSHILETLTSVCDSIHHLQNGVIAGVYSPEQFPLLDKVLFEQASHSLREKLDSLF